MRRRRRLLSLVVGLLFVLLSVDPALAVKAGGTYSWWTTPGLTGHYSLDSNIVPHGTYTPGTPYLAWFFAHQFWPTNSSNGGYIGLQVDSVKKAIFSWWGTKSSKCSTVPGAECGPFTGEGEGQRTLIPYNWQSDHEYRARVWLESKAILDNVSKPLWWVGSITDLATGVETIVGRIQVPAAYGWLQSGVNWTEDYGPDKPTCADYTKAVVDFRKLVADAGTVEASYPPQNDIHTAPCPSTIDRLGDPWVRHSTPL